jgi:fimbrial chaperone protein
MSARESSDMRRHDRRFQILPALCLAALLLAPGREAAAAALDVRPTLLQLLPGQKVGVLYLINQDDAPHTYQLNAFRWLPDGTRQREEATDDIIANPAILTIQPKQTQIIRYGLRGPAQSQPEAAYRMIISEVQPQDEERQTSSLTVLLRISLPLFVRQTGQLPAPKLSAGWKLGEHSLHVLVRNDGAFTARIVKATVKDEPAAALELTQLQYALPGGAADLEFKLTGNWAPRHATVELSVDGSDVTLPLSPAG